MSSDEQGPMFRGYFETLADPKSRQPLTLSNEDTYVAWFSFLGAEYTGMLYTSCATIEMFHSKMDGGHMRFGFKKLHLEDNESMKTYDLYKIGHNKFSCSCVGSNEQVGTMVVQTIDFAKIFGVTEPGFDFSSYMA